MGGKGAHSWVVGIHLGWGTSGLRSWGVGITWHARGKGTEKRATGVQFWLTQCGGWCSWVMGTHLGWGKPGFGSWAHVIKWLARGGGFGGNTKNRAIRARFCLTKRGEWCSCVVGPFGVG